MLRNQRLEPMKHQRSGPKQMQTETLREMLDRKRKMRERKSVRRKERRLAMGAGLPLKPTAAR